MGTNERSLQDILNGVSKRLEAHGAPSVRPRNKILSELEAFIACDDLLRTLNKEYRDAKEQRNNAAREYGADDGMTDMAAILEDSAWCAMQTRYMELRTDRVMMKHAQDLIEESRIEHENARRAEKDKEMMEIMRNLQVVSRLRKAQDDQQVALWFLIMWFMKTDWMTLRIPPTHQFNRLAA